MTQSRVFAIQVPAYRDTSSGNWVDKYDLSEAKHFGELVRVLDYGNVPKDPEPTRTKLFEAFKDYDFASDSVLLLGDPVAIAQAISVLACKLELERSYGITHTIRVLKWDRRTREYSVYHVG
jgi:hypothetical protein